MRLANGYCKFDRKLTYAAASDRCVIEHNNTSLMEPRIQISIPARTESGKQTHRESFAAKNYENEIFNGHSSRVRQHDVSLMVVTTDTVNK